MCANEVEQMSVDLQKCDLSNLPFSLPSPQEMLEKNTDKLQEYTEKSLDLIERTQVIIWLL